MSGNGEQQLGAALQRSQLLAVQKREEEALELVDEALAQLPDEPSLLLQRAWLLIRVDRHEPAIETLEFLLSHAPDETAAHFLLSIAYGETGEFADAESAIRRCLDADPENPEYRLQYANVLSLRSVHTRGGRARLRKQALEEVTAALALDPERVASYRWASRIVWRAGQVAEAKQYAEQGLAIAPDDEELLAAHADLTAATSVPTSRYDSVTRPAALVAEMTKLLAHNPQHRYARRTLFVQLWWQRTQVVDAPLALLPVFVIAIGTAFRPNGPFAMLVTGAVVVAVFGGLRLLTQRSIARRASPGYRELLSRETPLAALRRWLTLSVWILGVAGVVAAMLLRDAVVIRWLIVAFGALVLLALANSVLWQCCLPGAARRVGGFSDDVDSMQRIADYRDALRARLVLRIFGAVGLFALLPFVQGGRDDAMPVVALAAAALLIAPLVGLFVTRGFEGSVHRRLPEGTVPGPAYRRPGLVGFAFATAAAAGTAALLAVSLVSLPVLPGAHDAIGTYTLSGAGGGGGNGGDGSTECRGRPATRLACIMERNRERAERGYDITIPSLDVPDIEIPDVTVPSP